MIQPHFTYGLPAWGNANQCDMNKIIFLQKRAIRSITKSQYNSHTEHLLQECSILKIQDQFNVEVTLFMHDYVNNKLPTSFTNIYSHIRDNRENVQTRRSDNIYIPRCDSNFAMKLPLFNYPKIWNQWIKNNLPGPPLPAAHTDHGP